MQDISKAIVDGSLEAIGEKEKNSRGAEITPNHRPIVSKDEYDSLNRAQRRALNKLQRKSDALDKKIDTLSRQLPTKS